MIQCFLMCNIFQGIGNKEIDLVNAMNPNVALENRKTVRDYLGFTFYCASD